MKKTKIGRIIHYFDKIQVGVINVLDKEIKVGDQIWVGGDDGFSQAVTSMQVDHKSVEVTKAGNEVAIKLDKESRAGAEVFLIDAD